MLKGNGMASLEELLEQKKAIEQQIEKATREARASALKQVKGLIATHRFTAKELGFAPVAKPAAAAAQALPVMYRGPEANQVWSGRGKVPGWLAEAEKNGKKREEFFVGKA